MSGKLLKFWTFCLLAAMAGFSEQFQFIEALFYTTSQAAAMPEYVLVMIPVHWQGTRADFEAIANRQANLFIEESNLGAYADVRVLLFQESFDGSHLADSDLPFEMLRSVVKEVPADRYIGLTDGDLAPFGDSDIAGWTFGPGAQAVVAEAQYFTVTAHEIGHTFDLCDEYLYVYWKQQNDSWTCPNPFPPNCSPQDPWLCMGAPAQDGSHSIMGPAGGNGNYAFNEPSYDHLQSLFATMFEPVGDDIAIPLATPTMIPTAEIPLPTSPPAPTLTPTPTPDNLLQAAYSNPDLMIVGPEGEVLRLAAGPIFHPSWSPDGEELAFAATYNGNLDIFRISPNGGEPQVLIDWPSRELHPRWTASGNHLLFTSDKGGDFWLYRLNLRNGRVEAYEQLPRPASWPALTADGRHLAFAAAPDGIWSIYSADLDKDGVPQRGSLRRLSAIDVQAVAPAWHPQRPILAWTQRDAQGTALQILDLETSGRWEFAIPEGGWTLTWLDSETILWQTAESSGLGQHAIDTRTGRTVNHPAVLGRAGWPAIYRLEEGS